MREIQKRGMSLKGKSDRRLKFKCDKCGKVIANCEYPEKNNQGNGGCMKIRCDKCKTR